MRGQVTASKDRCVVAALDRVEYSEQHVLEVEPVETRALVVFESIDIRIEAGGSFPVVQAGGSRRDAYPFFHALEIRNISGI